MDEDEQPSDDDDEGYEYSDADNDDDSNRVYNTDSGDNSDSTSHNGDFQPDFSMKSKDELESVLNIRVSKTSETCNLPQSVAHALLRHYLWNEERLCADLFSDNPDNRLKAFEAAGVLSRSGESTPAERNDPPTSHECPICFDDELPCYQMPCGHPFCADCWTNFLTTMVNDGHHECVRKTCPEFKCAEIVTEDDVKAFAPTLLTKYRSLQLSNFIDLNNTTRWCPSPGCERVAVTEGSGTGVLEAGGADVVVKCDDAACGTKFCLRCGNEPHAPIRCEYLKMWIDKNNDGSSDTANWILLNTKQCPRCGNRIDKNGGCNHMTCKCKFEFCWMCMGDWKKHDGGYYKCNVFEEGKDNTNGLLSEEAAKKKALDKYLHHFERYQAHDKAQLFAKKQLTDETVHIRLQEFQNENNLSRQEAEFLNEANKQLVECRRVLKYTYSFAYYMKEKALMTFNYRDVDNNGDLKREASVQSNSSSTSKVRKKKVSKHEEPFNANGLDRQTSLNQRDVANKKKAMFEDHQKNLELHTEQLSRMVESEVKDINRKAVIEKTNFVKSYIINILTYVDEDY